MKFKLLIICFLTIFITGWTQDINKHKLFNSLVIGFHNNYRNAKIDSNNVDWFFELSLNTSIDSLIELSFKTSYEKDNGIKYFAHQERVETKYGYTQYYFDEEKYIDLFNVSIYYPIYKYLRLGFDISRYNDWKCQFYIGIKYKNIVLIDFAFYDEIRRLQYSLSPIFSFGKNEKFFLSYNISGMYIDNKHKWNAGFSLKYKIR